MFKEDAPTNSVGTGGEVSLPPDSEPGVKKRKKDLLAIKKMLTRKFPISEATNFGFKVELPVLGEVIVYGQSEAEIRKVLRRYIRPPYVDKDVKIERVYQSGVIKHYTQKRDDAIRGRNGVKIPNYAKMISQNIKMTEQMDNVNVNNQAQAGMQQQIDRQQQQTAQRQMQLKKRLMQNQLQQKKQDLQQKMKDRMNSAKSDNQHKKEGV